MRSYNYRWLLACLALMPLASCQDYENGFDVETVKKASYAKDFEKTFGTIDPNQDWSMAATINANIAFGGNAQVRVYSENPNVADNTFIGFVDNQHTSFNAVKGLDQVYAIVNVDGKYVVSGYYNVVNNSVTFSMNTDAKRSRSMTRAGSATCSLYDGENEGEDDGIIVSTCVSTRAGVAGTVPFPIQWFDGTTEAQKMTEVSGFDYDVWTTSSMDNYGPSKIGNFYIVNNPSFSTKVTRKLADMYDLFYEYETKSGTKKEAVFHETTNHVKPYFGKSVTDNEGLEKDAFFITKGNEPVTMTLVGKGTNKKNDVGYFYYPKNKEAEYLRSDGTLDFAKINKYVLITDASNSHDLLSGPNAYGITQNIVYQTYSQFQDAVKNAGTNADNYGASIQWKDTDYSCTVLTLPFFGDSENPTSETIDFPADYVVGFFLICNSAGTGSNQHLVCSFANVELNYFNDVPRGAAFTYLGKTYLGIEDDSDYDINDYVFEIGGVQGTTRDITPEDHKYYTKEEETSWVFASEDLGGSHDYDFNDVVWEFVQKFTISGEVGVARSIVTEFKGAYVRILASGGTLPVRIMYDGNAVGGKEVHQLFGQPESNLYTPINVTGTKPSLAPIEIPLASITEPVVDVNEIKDKFSVSVTGNDGQSFFVKAPNVGEAPQVLLLPAGWDWPSEGTHITLVYPDFERWTDSMEENGWIARKQGSYISNPIKVGGVEIDPSPTPTPTPSPSKAASNLTLSTSSATINLVAIGTEASETISYTTSSTGAITVRTSDNTVSATCNPSAKTITLTASQVVSNVTITVSQDADANYEAGSKSFTVSSVAPTAPEDPETPTTLGTLVTLDENGFISLSDLAKVATEGSISVIVSGKGAQWQVGSVCLSWNEPRPSWGEGQTQLTAIPGASASSEQYQTVGQPTTLTVTLTADQYATLKTYVGGLKVDVWNISDYSVYVKANE